MTISTGLSSSTYPKIITQGWNASGLNYQMSVAGIQWDGSGGTWVATISFAGTYVESGIFYVNFYYQ
jgi:hypothetical protein